MNDKLEVKAVAVGRETRVIRVGTEVHLIMECGDEARAAALFNMCQEQLDRGEINVRMVNLRRVIREGL